MAGQILAHLGYNLEREAAQLGLKVIVAGEEIVIHNPLSATDEIYKTRELQASSR